MKVFKKDLDFISNKIKEMGSKNKFILELIDTINECQFEKSKYQLRYYKRILKTLLFEKFGAETLYITNIKEVYPSDYPITNLVTDSGFKQFQLVIDKSERPYCIAVVLNVFDGDEVRLDSNGVMTDSYLKELSLNDFIKKLDLRYIIHNLFIRGMLIEKEEN